MAKIRATPRMSARPISALVYPVVTFGREMKRNMLPESILELATVHVLL